LAKESSRRPSSAYSCLMEMDSIMSGLPRELQHPLGSWLRSVRKEMPLPAAPMWKKALPPFLWLGVAAFAGFLLGVIFF